MKVLIKNGADVEAKDYDGNTMIHIAVLDRNFKILTYLCNNIKIDPR